MDGWILGYAELCLPCCLVNNREHISRSTTWHRWLSLTSINALQYHLLYLPRGSDPLIEQGEIDRSRAYRSRAYIRLLIRTRRNHVLDTEELRAAGVVAGETGNSGTSDSGHNPAASSPHSCNEGESATAAPIEITSLPIGTWRIWGEIGLWGPSTEFRSKIELLVSRIVDTMELQAPEERQGEALEVISTPDAYGIERLIFELPGEAGHCAMCESL